MADLEMEGLESVDIKFKCNSLMSNYVILNKGEKYYNHSNREW